MSDERKLDGWKAIATVLSESAGVEVSKEQARRYARECGLPVTRTGPGARKRIVAKLNEVVDWCVREFG